MKAVLQKASAIIGDDRGNIAMMFGLMLFVILGGAGIAIDLQRANLIRTEINEATDAGILAAARYKSSHPNADDGELTAVARKVFNNGIKNASIMNINTFNVTFDDETDTFALDVVGDVNALIMGALGNKYIDVGTRSEVRLGNPPLVEVVLALDVTGSMNNKGKIGDLRKSADELVEALFESKDANVKIGVVPFAQYVNVGKDYASASWLAAPSGAFTGCVGSRDYPYNIEDSDYAAQLVPGLDAALLGGGRCPDALTPLTNDKNVVKKTVSGLIADGSTFIPSGLLLGWQLLTPDAPFTEGVSFATLKKENGTKALILMTDGFNTAAPDYPTHGSNDVSLANDLTSELCVNIKKQDIVLYTIAFDLTDITIKDILEKCASSSSHYFDAENAGELADAFGAIASGLRNLSLSK